ncbi:MAG: alpha-E domain-containing protein, partial [Prosthecobacter sp.]|nr:alpha-E domain-containing protein [Prosthecobacter sp.]
VGGAVDAAQWHAVLRSASAVEAYRRFYVADILVSKVIEFLLFEESFPRSLLFCLRQMEALTHLISNHGEMHGNETGLRFSAFLRRLDDMDATDVFKQGLHEFLTEAQEVIASVGGHTYTTYMYHPPVDMEAEIRFHQQQEQQQQ